MISVNLINTQLKLYKWETRLPTISTTTTTSVGRSSDAQIYVIMKRIMQRILTIVQQFNSTTCIACKINFMRTNKRIAKRSKKKA